MPDLLRVAGVQERERGSREANLEAIEAAVARAAEAGAKLVLLQELHNGPYFCQVEHVDQFERAEPIPGPSSERLSALAAKHGVVLVASLFERRAAGLYHNTALVFERDGTLLGALPQDAHPGRPGLPREVLLHAGRPRLPSDPDLARQARRAGVLGPVVPRGGAPDGAGRRGPAALPDRDRLGPERHAEEQARQRDAWITVQRGHAVANGLPLLAVNRVGFEPSPEDPQRGIQFWGSSFVAGPQGEVLASAGTEAPELLVVDVDTARSEAVRRIWPFLRDRRVDAYGDLLKRFRD
jgi:N-carbamoylputrescine amidase